jgi:hypothetical protein
VRAAEVAVRAEDLALSLFGEEGADEERVVRAQRHGPSGAGIPLGDGQHRLPEGVHAELVAAELARLQHPVEPGLGERSVQSGRVVAQLFRLILLIADRRDQRPSPRDDRLGGQVRLRRGYLRVAWHSYETDAVSGPRQGVGRRRRRRLSRPTFLGAASCVRITESSSSR